MERMPEEGSRGFSEAPKLGREKRANARTPRRELESIFLFFRIKLNGFFLLCLFILLNCKLIFASKKCDNNFYMIGIKSKFVYNDITMLL